MVRPCGIEFGYAEARTHRKIGSDGLPHRFVDGEDEEIAARSVPAPCIVAPVRGGRGKLCDEISVSPVQMDAVEASGDRAARRILEGRNHLLDVGLRHFLRLPAENLVLRYRRSNGYDVWHDRLASGVGEFGEDQAATSVHRAGEPLEPGDEIVGINPDLPRRALAAWLDINVPGHEEACSAIGELR